MEAETKSQGVVKVEVIRDPEATLAMHRTALKEMDAYWIAQHKAFVAKEGEAGPRAQEVLAIRKLLQGLLAPRLEEVAKEKREHLSLYLNLLVPFDAAGGLKDFLLHFFQLDQVDGNLVYKTRDVFERDAYVLYDVYRVKKTREVINALRASRKNDDRRFPSIFSEADIARILDSLDNVLDLLFAQCLPAARRKEILPVLTPRFLQGDNLLTRRENNIFYAYPHVLEKYDYRRFFFLVYFKNGLRAKVGPNEEREFHYNFLDFQVVKHEFLVHWLSRSLREDPRKLEVYKKYMMHGKTMMQLVMDNPEQEAKYLQQMPSHTLNDMAGEVNEELPDEMKIGAVPQSEKYGLYHRLKKQLTTAVEMVRAPIEILRKKVMEAPETPWEDPTDEVIEMPEPKQEPPRWEVTLLKAKQIQRPFLTDSIANFNAMINAIKVKLGSDWRDFSSYTTALLDRTPEMSTIRRRTPKHEWAMPFLARYVIPGQGQQDYLLILGAEAKAKGRGMGYNTREQYNLTPYMVFATDSPGEGFGEPVRERVYSGHQLQEYSIQVDAVRKKAMEVFAVVKSRNGG